MDFHFGCNRVILDEEQFEKLLCTLEADPRYLDVGAEVMCLIDSAIKNMETAFTKESEKLNPDYEIRLRMRNTLTRLYKIKDLVQIT